MAVHHLTYRILAGMIAGIVAGMLLKLAMPMLPALKPYLVDGLLFVVGQVFVASLKMLVVPLILVSLICGVNALRDVSALGRIGLRALGWYLLTTAMAITIGLALASWLQPGVGVAIGGHSFDVSTAPSLTQVLINLFPSNPFAALSDGNTLQVIVFALLFGVAMVMSGEAGQRLAAWFEDANSVVLKLVMLLMHLAPYGVFALMARLFFEQEFSLILQLAGYFAVVLVALVAHLLVSYGLLLRAHGLSPLLFLYKMREVVLFAFTTASSNATIPVTLDATVRKLGVDRSIASFTVPLGATVNMDGTAIMQGVATVFIAQMYQIDLSMTQFLMIIATATLASIGTAGVPGVGLVMLTLVLQQVGLPVEAIGLIIGVDRLLDMSRTAVNVCGDAMVSMIIGRAEGRLDTTVFADRNAGTND
ncbi:MAG: dicarboxylate/amino acid:cation symporter [Gammaproteobacteria bacterium]|nr:dicarboxylate/amino acid:cation symporter [Gammaproteobacteria bacterium]